MRLCSYLVCLSMTVAFAEARAQDDGLSGYGVETNILAGRIIKHTKKFTSPIPRSSAAFDINFVEKTRGKRSWQQRLNYPQVGIGLTSTDYGNRKVFGFCQGAYINIQATLLHSDKLEWTFRIGDGLGYVTRKYQRNSPVDTVNVAIGTHINDFAIFMTDVRYRMNEHWRLQAGFNFTHISNGDFHQPNLGVNMAGIHAGVQYFPVTDRPERLHSELPRLTRRWLLQARAGFGFNEANARGNPELPVYVITGYVSKRWCSNDKIFAGVDYVYHTPTYAFYKTWGIDIGHEMGHAWDGTFFVGNEFLVGRIGLVTQIGYYYRKTYLNYGNDPINEKIGSNFYFIQNEKGLLREAFASVIMTTHTATAEFVEFGLGFGF